MVNHKNEIKTDNSVWNLEWVSAHYNNTYKNRHIKVGRKLTKKIACYKDNKLVKIYTAIKDTKYDGFNENNIISVLKGRTKSAYGYQWSYL